MSRPKLFFEGKLVEQWNPVGVTRGPATWESIRKADKMWGWSHEETLVQGCDTKQKTRCHPSSHQESFRSPQHQRLAVLHPAVELRAWALRPPPCKVSDRALRMPCVPSRVGASCLVSPLVCPTNADPAVLAEIECVKQWLVFWQTYDEFARTLVRRSWRLSLEQLREFSSCWVKVVAL